MELKNKITLEHGSGSREARELISNLLLPGFKNRYLAPLADAASFKSPGDRLAFTTDSFVVSPLFFPGGDIGKLAVCGTVNDLAVAGARPIYLSCSFIIEENLDLSVFKQIVHSIGQWAKKAGVLIVTGDTKVVEAGNADKLYINTAGIGTVPDGLAFSPERVRTGDAVIISGTIAEHGLAVLAAREELDISPQLKSDCAPLNGLTEAMLKSGADIKMMRDPTRGGLAAVLNELAEGRNWGIELLESRLPVHARVKAALEILGLDPLSLASEGKLCAIVGEKDAERLVGVMKREPAGKRARIIGRVVREPRSMVILETEAGGRRIVDWPRGAPIPRIC
ncbi:MAG: hydrogenase expression/formation protein HypE [Candidatus Euphemobacter frigidus]|nr:hydrogenase expression/formation protein HypE [Candidatus Euphemobacter frigidus]MDP8276758.1 hydrogenase expression/formation protein HypE [Candidatus Euphemobacter frigidus]